MRTWKSMKQDSGQTQNKEPQEGGRGRKGSREGRRELLRPQHPSWCLAQEEVATCRMNGVGFSWFGGRKQKTLTSPPPGRGPGGLRGSPNLLSTQGSSEN